MKPSGLKQKKRESNRVSATMMNIRERAEYLPTRRQIRAACEAIRRRWTAAERRRRTVGESPHATAVMWSPPHIATANCLARVRRVVAEASA